jgi:hypothetical protein
VGRTGNGCDRGDDSIPRAKAAFVGAKEPDDFAELERHGAIVRNEGRRVNEGWGVDPVTASGKGGQRLN